MPISVLNLCLKVVLAFNQDVALSGRPLAFILVLPPTPQELTGKLNPSLHLKTFCKHFYIHYFT